MKIICVGWNYRRHNNEMEYHATTAAPTIFMKPDSAILRDGKPFFLPNHLGRVEYEAELVIRIDRLGKNISQRFASRYYHSVTLGIDFTARELQQKLRTEGSPWEISKSFDQSAAIGEFIEISDEQKTEGIYFNFLINGEERQTSCSTQMIHSIDSIISYVSKFFTLKIGDLIFTGTPDGVGEVKIGDSYWGAVCGVDVLNFSIK